MAATSWGLIMDLENIQKRLYQKYEVTLADSELAIEYLLCFLDAKKSRPNELIILPQIVDWAWHEFILDTASYRDTCMRMYGRLLHHVATSIQLDITNFGLDMTKRDVEALNPLKALRKSGLTYRSLPKAFQESLIFMQEVYGLQPNHTREYWLDAGWRSPSYKLRPDYQTSLFELGVDFDAIKTKNFNEPNTSRFLSWLPGRIIQRFGLPIDVAIYAVQEYAARFLATSSSRNSLTLGEHSDLCEIAWGEHILWTTRYDEDCTRFLGKFLDHSPQIRNHQKVADSVTAIV